jgi:hypothetical protein
MGNLVFQTSGGEDELLPLLQKRSSHTPFFETSWTEAKSTCWISTFDIHLPPNSKLLSAEDKFMNTEEL